ncbi:hypothetical protein F4813DRAFT_341144 [Daldinia decipiens]|uniref:uncharacterized protein n=1 Tax=Daldinia decipiens TaxID=326647 RepID=UPI0020C51A7B|nr:uncharacterized protein F4813DRAFT_341144 [Daldinia decipiens]KAI1662578.1 hypothetical protein F4813DRAFT_341144 [Daldinia decipiens]
MDDVPPPPYTETDIHSHSSRSPVAQPGVNDDNVSVTTSSQSTTVYTPPETPRESHFNFPGSDDNHTTSSAHSYFESRPTIRGATDKPFVISLAITEDASPNDFPYPGWASEHDTTEQDWRTFLNYLLPDHASRANSNVIERKLQAEDEKQSSNTSRSIAEAQLGQIKSSINLATQSLHDVDAMIREWNDGFFGPRGVTIERATPQPPSTSRTSATQQIPPVEPQPQPQPQGQSSRSWWNPFRPLEANSRGLRMGRLTIDNDRVSFGDSFEVDRNGVRWGGQSADGSSPFAGPGTRDFPAGPGPFGDFQQGRGFGEHGIGRGCGRGRWWRDRPDHDHRGSRDRSPSSSSSCSSSSDSGSGSSIGSLPDCDDLNDSQLPYAKQSIRAWLDHPEQPVTKEMLRALRSEIKAAKNAPPPANDPAWEVNKQATRREVQDLLVRFKTLKREQKRRTRTLRKKKREQKKALKRERRERKRAEKRERKNLQRDVRNAEREMGGHSRRGPGDADSSHPFPPVFGDMPIPAMPSVPSDVPGNHPMNVPNFPFGRGGRGRGGPFGGHHTRYWEAYLQNAKQQAEQVRDLAQQQANQARAHAQAEANMARAEAQRTANAARAQAAATAAAAMWASVPRGSSPWGSGPPPPPPPPPPTTNDKLQAADTLDAQIIGKMRSLRALRETIEREQTEAALRGEEERGEDKKSTSKEVEASVLEDDIERLQQDVERLRFEGLQLQADEELARRLQEEEHRRG